jgi:hypothetical protein
LPQPAAPAVQPQQRQPSPLGAPVQQSKQEDAESPARLSEPDDLTGL